MLIVNDDHRMRAGVCSLNELCPYCGLAFADYPLIMSDDASQTVYHVACALELATDPLRSLYLLQSVDSIRPSVYSHSTGIRWAPVTGGSYATNGS